MARGAFFFQAKLVNPNCKTQTDMQRLELKKDLRFLARFKKMNMRQTRQTGAGGLNCWIKIKAGHQVSINYKPPNVDELNRLLQSGSVHVAVLSLCLHNVPPTLFLKNRMEIVVSDLVTLILGVHLVTGDYIDL